MPTYIDEREKEIHEDFTQLMNRLSAVGKDLLLKFGEMRPSSGTISTQGEFTLLSASIGDEQLSSQAIYEQLRRTLLAGIEQKRLRAVGICMNVTAAGPRFEGIVNALAIELIHSKGEAIWFFIPYSTRGGKVVEFGEPFWRK